MSSSADDAAPAPWTVKDVLEHLGAASSSARVRSSMRDIDGALAAYAKGIARVLACLRRRWSFFAKASSAPTTRAP
jgi:hypothetical protein